MNFQVINKNALHVLLNKDSIQELVFQLKVIHKRKSGIIEFEEALNYRGEKLSGLQFNIEDNGEYVEFANNHLRFEIELEMFEDLLIVLNRALEENGFRTPELMSFQAKTKKDKNLTLYGIFS